MTHRIILDTDLGSDVDDALSLALALASPEIEIAAITHVSRDARRRAQITKRLLELARRTEIPVHAGRDSPLSGANTFAWFGHEGDAILEAGAAPRIEAEDAVAALCRLLRASDGLELVAIGPLTNIAAALDLEPSVASRIERLTVMGGHIRRVAYGGCEFPFGADYNLCSDPQASVRVLRAGIPTRLVPIDVTLQVWLRQRDLRRIEAAGGPFRTALSRAVRQWTPTMNSIFGGMGASMQEDNVAFLHDPLALACVYDESFCTFDDLAIEPAIAGGVFRTIEHPGVDSEALPMRCATAVDAERFRAHFVDRITGAEL